MTIPCDNNRKICLLRGCQFPCRDHGRKFNLLQVWISSMFYIEDGSTFAHKIRQHQFSSGFTPAQRKTCTITSCIVQVLQCCLIFWHICHNRSKSAFFGFYSSSKKSILFPIVYCKIYNVAWHLARLFGMFGWWDVWLWTIRWLELHQQLTYNNAQQWYSIWTDLNSVGSKPSTEPLEL